MSNNPRPRELSGITPSGSLTLGNYLGALRRFVERQHEVDGFYFVADLHALTTAHDPVRHRHLTRSTAATFLAAGLDPAVSTIFIQSHVPTHVAFAYLLECTAHVGELSRMIQFKEKGSLPGARASLFTYPCLMAADILLYQAQTVPVGGDQSQHVELTRDLAQRFNTLYGDTLVVPELEPAALAARVADLQDPMIKMNKSAAADAAGVIRILDSPDVIIRKIRRAVTDSDNHVRYEPDTKPGVANLLDILAVLAGTRPEDEAEQHTGYGALKNAVADAVVAALEPIQARHDDLIADPQRLDSILQNGAQRAHQTSQPVLDRAEQAWESHDHLSRRAGSEQDMRDGAHHLKCARVAVPRGDSARPEDRLAERRRAFSMGSGGGQHRQHAVITAACESERRRSRNGHPTGHSARRGLRP